MFKSLVPLRHVYMIFYLFSHVIITLDNIYDNDIYLKVWIYIVVNMFIVYLCMIYLTKCKFYLNCLASFTMYLAIVLRCIILAHFCIAKKIKSEFL